MFAYYVSVSHYLKTFLLMYNMPMIWYFIGSFRSHSPHLWLVLDFLCVCDFCFVYIWHGQLEMCVASSAEMIINRSIKNKFSCIISNYNIL